MLRLLLVSLLLPIACAQTADRTTTAPEQHMLWPQGAPGALGVEAKDKPQILVHHAAAGAKPRPAIVICPGGGYGHLAMDHEGHQIAAWLRGLGITAVILDYRHRGKGYGHPFPLLDAQRALRFVRAHADQWGIDGNKVGVMGFSAGGHLASSVSVHHDAGDHAATDVVDRHSCRPDFAVLCYPVIAFGQECTHRGSQDNLLGPDPAAELVRKMSSDLQVTATTPPTFLWHTTADRVVSPRNSIAYYLALQAQGVPCELHMFEAGAHGLGLAKEQAAENWPSLCSRWLVGRGVLAP